MREKDFKKMGKAIAEKHGWRFVGHFFPAANDMVLLNFEREDGALTFLQATGTQMISLTQKDLLENLMKQAGDLPKPSRIVAPNGLTPLRTDN